MRRAPLTVLLLAFLLPGCAELSARQAPAGEVRLNVYRASRVVGHEVIRTSPGAEGTTEERYETEITLGPGVALTGSLARTARHEPLRAFGAGKDLPWYAAQPDWGVDRDAGAAAVFPISGPFPVGRQAALVRYWLARGRPSTVRTPDGRSMAVAECGTAGEGREALRCYEVSGLVWGRSLVWMNAGGEPRAAFVSTLVGNLEYLAEEAMPIRAALLAVAARGGVRMAEVVRPVATAADAPLVLRGVNLVDVVRGITIADAVVVVSGERIVAAGPAAMVQVPAGARVVDLPGKTVLPGLWDMHAHLRNADWGPAYLGTGITTVRDLGNDLEFVRELRRGANEGASISPRVLLAGFIDATANSNYPEYDAATPAQGEAWVDRYRDAGFDEIKVWENVPAPVLPAIVARAHARGLRVTGHIPSAVSLRQGVEAGMDGINHVWPLMHATQPGTRDGFASARELAAFLARAGTVVDPTLVVAEYRLHRLGEPLVSLDPGGREVPADLLAGNQGLRGPAGNAAQGTREFQRALDIVRELHRAGVPIVAGSDQGIAGWGLLREIELYVLAGLSPLDAIRSATIVPARVMGMADRVGSLAPGMAADLLVVDGDPLADIGALRNSCAVMRGGRMFDTRVLRAAAGFRVADGGACLP